MTTEEFVELCQCGETTTVQYKECFTTQTKIASNYPKDFNNYTFTPGAMAEDLVHNSAPYIHLQILRPKDDEQRDKAIAYFKEHQKQYITFADRKYCLNPQSLSDDAKVLMKTPEEVMQAIRKDELYYLATNGGITFGGGEPLLRAEFIKEVLELGAKQWPPPYSLYPLVSIIQTVGGLAGSIRRFCT